jgi:lysophospholipase L1-like esterase
VSGRARNFLINGTLVLASVALCAAALEGGARIYRRLHPQPPNNRYSFRMMQPPPYRGAPYFSAAFVDESFRQPGGWYVPAGTRLVVPGDFHGRYFNVENGRRRTTDAPASAEHTLWVVGGSTVYSAEVPDAYTIPSYLQRMLNRKVPGVWRVVNCGSISLTTGQQLELLRTLPLGAGDMVVFYDGVNDVVEGVYNGDPRGWIVGENRKALRGAGPFKAVLAKLNLKYAASKIQYYSALFGTVVGDLVNGANLRPRPQLLDPAKTAALVRETAALFRQNVQEAARYTAGHGAAFVHFLQPQVFAEARRTPYEESLVRNFYINPNGLETAFDAAYPLLQAATISLAGVRSYDISHVLDRRCPGEEFYLDYCHVNHAANERIAAAMLPVLTAADQR